MRAVGSVLVAAVIGLAVAWLLVKMSRSDDADLRLLTLALAAAAALIGLLAGIAGMRRRRDRL